MIEPAAPAIPILVFARAPVPGACKTRLARRYGPIGAARLHRQLTEKTLAAAGAAGGPVQLWTTGGPHRYFAAQRGRCTLILQPGGDLGRRMSRAIDTVLGGGALAAILVGTDCAALTAEDFARARGTLRNDEADVVLQPADDGGFVLIGSRVPLGPALRNVAWSSGRELAQTLLRLHRRGLRVALMRGLWDVDRPADVRRARRDGLL